MTTLPQIAWPDARPGWDDLTPEDQIAQIRLGELSEFIGDFIEDPTVVAHCPEHGGQIITAADTECSECSRDLIAPAVPSFDNWKDAA